VVVVVDVVGVVDGGCAAVVEGDVVGIGGDDGLVVVSSWCIVCVTASAVLVEVVWVLEFVTAQVVGSVCRAAHWRSGAGLVCAAVSTVTVVGVGALCGLVFVCVSFHRLHSSAIPPLYASSILSSTSSPHCWYAFL
jgi:hypothetical protein